MTTILLSEIAVVRVLCKSPSCGAVTELHVGELPGSLRDGDCPACGRPAVDATGGNPVALLARALRAVATPHTRGDVELVLAQPPAAADRSGPEWPGIQPDGVPAYSPGHPRRQDLRHPPGPPPLPTPASPASGHLSVAHFRTYSPCN